MRVEAIAVVVGMVTLAPAVMAQSRRALAELGRLNPPAYGAPLERAGDPSSVFDEAIGAYGRRQFQRAADLLRRFIAAEPEDPAGNFFLAASLMMTDEVGEAEDRLGAVIAAGETAFAAPARFVLAKALIRTGRLDAAEQQLDRVSRGDSPFAREAGELLPRVRALKRRR